VAVVGCVNVDVRVWLKYLVVSRVLVVVDVAVCQTVEVLVTLMVL
jgi:hypothetical protein